MSLWMMTSTAIHAAANAQAMMISLVKLQLSTPTKSGKLESIAVVP
jgi:hypothetical protein